MDNEEFQAIKFFFIFTSPVIIILISILIYNKFNKEEPKRKKTYIPIDLIDQVEKCLKKRPALLNEFKSFKKYEVGFYKNLNINNSKNEFEKDNQILIQLLKYFQKLWSMESLELFYKELTFPENLMVISEINQRPIQEFNYSELNSIQIICSKPLEYKELKKKFIEWVKANPQKSTDNFLTSSVTFLENYSFESLKLFFSQIQDHQKIIILPLFYHFEPDDSFHFLQNYTFKTSLNINFYLGIIENECKNMMAAYTNLEDKSHLLCQNCLIRPKVKQVKKINYLCCPSCNLVKYLKPGFYNLIAVIGKKVHENEIEVWKENKIKIFEATSIILRFEKNIDFDWALTSFLHEFELHFPHKKINIVIENVHLQENTLRMIQDQVKFNLVFQK